jgi:hypothetical protein
MLLCQPSWLHNKWLLSARLIKPYTLTFLTSDVNRTIIIPLHTPSVQPRPYTTLPYYLHLLHSLIQHYMTTYDNIYTHTHTHPQKNNKTLSPNYKNYITCTHTHTITPLDTGTFACWLHRHHTKSKSNFTMMRTCHSTLCQNQILSLHTMTIQQEKRLTQSWWGKTGIGSKEPCDHITTYNKDREG